MKLVKACLEDKFDNIEGLMVGAAQYSDRKLAYHEVFIWNAFRDARERDDFNRALNKAFPDVGNSIPAILAPTESNE